MREIDEANAETLRRMLAGDPVLVDCIPAGEAIPALEPGLILHCPGLQHPAWVDAVQPRQDVEHGDEPAEQSVLVDVALEQRDPASGPGELVPVRAGFRIEPVGQMAIVGDDVVGPIGFAEEPEERLEVR